MKAKNNRMHYLKINPTALMFLKKRSNTLHAFSMYRRVWMSEIAGHGDNG